LTANEFYSPITLFDVFSEYNEQMIIFYILSLYRQPKRLFQFIYFSYEQISTVNVYMFESLLTNFILLFGVVLMLFKKVTNKDAGFESLDNGVEYIVAILPLNEEGQLSATCKTMNYATTHGNVATGIMIENKPLMVGLNAFVSIPKHERKPDPTKVAK
jgi:hypothetical protein